MKRIVKICICFIFFLSFLFSQQNEDLSYIDNLISLGNYEEVIKILTSKENEIISQPKIGYYLGICYFRIKNYNLAEKYFEKAYINGYTTSYLFYNLGVTKYKIKKYNEAIEFLEKTSTDKLVYDKSLYIIIVSYLKLKNKKAAIESYKKLQRSYPYSINLLKAQDVLEKFGIDYKKYTSTKNVALYIQANYGYETNLNYAADEYYELIGLKDSFYSTYISALFFDETYSISLDSMFKNYLNYTDYNYKNFFSSLKINLVPSLNVSLALFGNYYVEDEPLQKNLGSKIKSRTVLNDLILEVSAVYSIDDYFNINYQVLNGVSQEYILSSSIDVFKIDIGYKIKTAQSSIYSYNILYFAGRIEKRFKKVLVSFGGNMSNKSYENIREDKIYSLYGLLRIKLTNHIELNFNYTNSISNSSDIMYSYKTQYYSFGTSLYF